MVSSNRLRHTLLCLLLITAASPSFGQDVKAARAGIQAQVDRLSKAFMTKNAKVFDSIMAPDFVSESAKGRMFSRPDALQVMTETLAAMQKVTLAATKIKSVTMKKGIAIVLSDNMIKGTIKMPSGKVGHLVSRYSTREQWLKVKGVWMVRYAKELEGAKTTIDGKAQPVE